MVRHGVPRGRHCLIPSLWLHRADLARGGHAQLHGAGGRGRVIVNTHLEGSSVQLGLVLSAVLVQEAWEDQCDGERQPADTEEHESDDLTHVQVEVEGDGRSVHDLDVVGDGAGEDGPLGDEVPHQDADHTERQEVDANPDEHLPPDGGGDAAVATGAGRGEQVAPGVVLVDVGVLVDVRLVEVVQVRLDAEVVGAAPHLPRRRPSSSVCYRAPLAFLVNHLHRLGPSQTLPLCRTLARRLFLAVVTASLTASAGHITGQCRTPAIAATAHAAHL